MRPPLARDPDPDRAYIGWRVVDACLREDLRACISQGREAPPPASVREAWGGPSPGLWWRIAHWPDGPLWLPVRRSDCMQPVAALGDAWVHEGPAGARLERGVEPWLRHLAAGLDPDTRRLHREYALEAECAVHHRRLAGQAWERRAPQLAGLLDAGHWSERALRADQLASYRDHPFYPTARAKSGFDEAAMRAYAPEFDPVFDLRWLAVPRTSLTRTTSPPPFWPRLRDLGLSAALEASHAALPVHPLTWARLHELGLPPGCVRAPDAWLRVRPTLSVRTVMPVAHPDRHLKLPLPMRTLGALNLRLIKPSTLYDGHWLARALGAIADTDPVLRGRCLHVDESHGGHVAQAPHLAYLVRGYPESLAVDTPVPVAALCAPMPDGRPLAFHLAARFHDGDPLAWWRAHATLLCRVHLRLWLVYGIALEANQQNAVLLYRPGVAPRLLMKDNDSARVLLPRLFAKLPQAAMFGPLRDGRIAVDGDAPLARMFCTITLQLCLQAVLEGVCEARDELRGPMYRILREVLADTLQALADEGVDTAPAWRLLRAPRLPVKYLLSAGSLLGKQATGAADINKFYGDSGPNFMLAGTAPAPACAT